MTGNTCPDKVFRTLWSKLRVRISPITMYKPCTRRTTNVPEVRESLLLPHEFFLPFVDNLNEENRWVKRRQFVRWDLVDEYYAKPF